MHQPVSHLEFLRRSLLCRRCRNQRLHKGLRFGVFFVNRVTYTHVFHPPLYAGLVPARSRAVLGAGKCLIEEIIRNSWGAAICPCPFLQLVVKFSWKKGVIRWIMKKFPKPPKLLARSKSNTPFSIKVKLRTSRSSRQRSLPQVSWPH